jgi:hypothetical protein
MWIELHDSAREHPKTLKLAKRLGIGPGAALGYICSLWCWTLRMAPDGDLGSFDAEDIAIGAQWEGDPKAFVDALVAVKYLDVHETGYRVHDWQDYSGSLKSAERTRVYRERKRDAQSRHSDVTQNMSRHSDVTQNMEPKETSHIEEMSRHRHVTVTQQYGDITLTDRPTDRPTDQTRPTHACAHASATTMPTEEPSPPLGDVPEIISDMHTLEAYLCADPWCFSNTLPATVQYEALRILPMSRAEVDIAATITGQAPGRGSWGYFLKVICTERDRLTRPKRETRAEKTLREINEKMGIPNDEGVS